MILENDMDATNRVKPLTKVQKDMMQFITKYSCEKEYPPTLKEISEVANMTAGGVRYHLSALKRRGLIDWQEGASRTIRILKKGA